MAALSGADPLIVAGLTGDGPRLEAARQLGATRTIDVQAEDLEELVRDLAPLGADVVCDASGASRPLDVALRLARPDGQVTKVGWSPDEVADRHESAGAAEHPAAGLVQPQLSGLGTGHPPARPRLTMPETIIGLRAPLDGWRDAFDAMHDRRVIKSVLPTTDSSRLFDRAPSVSEAW